MKTRDRLIEVGAQVIALEGLRNFTAKNLGGKLNISDAAIFKHFPTMEQLAIEIIEKYTLECMYSIDRAIEQGKDAIDKLARVIDTHIELLEETKGVIPILCFEFSRSNNEEIKSRIFSFLSEYAEKISGILTEGIEKGLIRDDIDISEVSLSFIGFMQSRVVMWFLRNRKGPIIRDPDTVKKVFLEGLAKECSGSS